MLSRTSLSSLVARSKASGLHAYQSTGLFACWSKYGLVSLMSRFGIGLQRITKGFGGNCPVRGVPDNARVFYQKRLRGFMADTETLGNGIGQLPVFDYENDSGLEVFSPFGKVHELVADLIADRALRAMLKNENGIGFGL